MSGSFLAETQARVWRLIAWPEGVREGLAQEPPGTAPLATLIVSDERLPAEERLEVYANAYFYRIHDVLAEDFPTLAALLGADDFHDLATSYLAVHPSTHPSLRHVGRSLSGFLAAHDAASSFRGRFPFAADCARFEAATEDVFDAAEAPTASREALGQLAPEAWDRMQLKLRPSVRLLALDWPVHEARRAVREGEPLPQLSPAPTHLCLWRRDEQVVTRELEAEELLALRPLEAGIEFGALCARVAGDRGSGSEEEAVARVAGWLTGWTDAGLLLPPAG